ncbi:MAG TPA: hypothetical protein VIK56_15620 [Rhodoferax sp.]
MSGCTQVCNQGRDCTCTTQHCLVDSRTAQVAPVKAREFGNVWLADPEPPEPLTRGEMLIVWGTVLALGLIGLVLMAFSARYMWTRWLA